MSHSVYFGGFFSLAHHGRCGLPGPAGGKVGVSSACCAHNLLQSFCCCVLASGAVRVFPGSSLQTSALFLSQVYGLFEGMLEKLELDDDGKSQSYYSQQRC